MMPFKLIWKLYHLEDVMPYLHLLILRWFEMVALKFKNLIVTSDIMNLKQLLIFRYADEKNVQQIQVKTTVCVHLNSVSNAYDCQGPLFSSFVNGEFSASHLHCLLSKMKGLL